MSRRESRVSMGARQNDALFEFENFKKKFLLANKHITKLNSTLSVRIEELNAQISTLYVENLRLRASEIALAAQLKREREKSRKIMADAEAATLNLTKHLSYLRQSFNILPGSPSPPSPPSPQAQRPPPSNPNTSPSTPQGNRISRAPNVPGIYEEDEPCASSSEQEPGNQPSPKRKKTKPRLSASKLPLPMRVASPTPLPTPVQTPLHVDLNAVAAGTKRKATSRRQSGLLSVNTDSLSVPRPASPAFGSPIRLEAGRAEEEEEIAAISGKTNIELEVVQVELEVDMPVKKERRKSKPKEREPEVGEREGVETARTREKRRMRDEDDYDGTDAPKFKLKDVTNETRTALQPIDNTVHEHEQEIQPLSATRAFLDITDASSRPTSRGSSSPAPPGTEGDGDGGRQRRARKSVNYAEPKLNTKMRKPDPPSGSEPSIRAPSKKRTSAAAVLVRDGNDADNDTETRSSVEMVRPNPNALQLRGVNGNFIDPGSFPLPPSRPGSSQLSIGTVGSYSPGPSSRSTSAAGSASGSTSGTATSSSTTTTSSSSGTSVKRKKSRAAMLLDEESDSDGAEADAEYVPPGARSWVNVEGRRKTGERERPGGPKRAPVRAGISSGAESEGRRHSMAV
ncbi:hypothetical protein BDQ12DRAFT_688188 [Crucibulum laeve]|uniref:Shugoshin C-terminal domain-containing protein n=1 Tax=Crucibulum laeve TaxID=68775 RepID=A0A5C3LRP4_9AGAR|nr:hypothetical protein BDQ12DRAFT_688188 [Crucibulum laeve]